MKKLQLALFLSLFIHYNTYAQQIDKSFGDQGIIQLTIPDVSGVIDIEDNIIINNLYDIQSYNHSGAKNINFGNSGTITNPFSTIGSYLINKTLLYNNRFTLLGCSVNGETSADLSLIQIEHNTGDQLTEFNLSYSKKPHNDEFFSHNIIEDTLRIFGKESYYEGTPGMLVNNGLSASVDTEGNVVNPENEFKILEGSLDVGLNCLMAHELYDDRVLHIYRQDYFYENYTTYSYTITDDFYQNQDPFFDDNSIGLPNLWGGINEVIQLDEKRIFFTSNTHIFAPSFYSGFVLDIETEECIPISQDYLPDDYKLKDIIFSDKKEILLTGTKGENEHSQTGFVCKLNSDLVLDTEFGINGYYEFELDGYSLKQKKSFYTKDNIFISYHALTNDGSEKELLLKISLEDLVATKETELHPTTFRVSPNPSADFSLLHISSTEEIYKIEIYNSNGQLLQTVKSTGEIRNDHLIAGVYCFKIFAENKIIETQKIIKK